MPFDPTKPANSSLIVAAELRDQFNALNAQLQAVASQLATLDSLVQSDTARNCTSVQTFAEQGISFSDTEKQQLADKLGELITTLRR